MPLFCVCSSLQQDRKVSFCSEIPCHFDTGYSSFPSWTWAPHISRCWAPLNSRRACEMLVEQPPYLLLRTETCEQRAVLWVRRAVGSWHPETSVCSPQQEHLQAACMGGLWTPSAHLSGFIPQEWSLFCIISINEQVPQITFSGKLHTLEPHC